MLSAVEKIKQEPGALVWEGEGWFWEVTLDSGSERAGHMALGEKLPGLKVEQMQGPRVAWDGLRQHGWSPAQSDER